MDRPIMPAPMTAVWMWCWGVRVGGVGNMNVLEKVWFNKAVE